jgi:hypothetical protein
VVKVIQKYSSFQIIHTKVTVNSLGYRCTNYATQMDICMTWKLTMTTTNWTVTSQGLSQFVQGMDNWLSSTDLCNNLHAGKIQCCGPVRSTIKEECCRIFTRKTQTKMGWHLDRVGRWSEWSVWTRIAEHGVLSPIWKEQLTIACPTVSQCETAFCYNICNSSKGLHFFSVKKYDSLVSSWIF